MSGTGLVLQRARHHRITDPANLASRQRAGAGTPTPPAAPIEFAVDMPTYQYRCKTCDARFDWVQSMAENALTTCPAEGGPTACQAPGRGQVTKVFGAVGITFKGSGFYKTDSRSGSGSKSKTKTKSNGSGASGDGESKPAAASSTSSSTSSSSSSGSSGSSGSSD
jgi:putative FmdB family regulatory protein